MLLFRILAVAILALSPDPAFAQPLTISAAASLRSVLDKANATFSAAHPESPITANYGGSGALEQQIQNGAPVDVFISASPREMDSLNASSLLLPASRRILLGNAIVLISPSSNPLPLSFLDLTNPAIQRIAIGSPKSVPAGQYAMEIFDYFKISSVITPKLIFAKDVRAVLTYTETRNVDVGIVYLTDALQSPNVSLRATAPATSHAPVIYPAAIIRTSKYPATAFKYLDFLQSPPISKIFESAGFTIPNN